MSASTETASQRDRGDPGKGTLTRLIRRTAWAALLGLFGFILFGVGCVASSLALQATGFIIISIVLFGFLLLLVPAIAVVHAAADTFPHIKFSLRLATGVLLWCALTAFAIVALPVQGNPRATLYVVVGTAISALFLATYGIGPDPHRLYRVFVGMIITGIATTIISTAFHHTTDELSGLRERGDNVIATVIHRFLLPGEASSGTAIRSLADLQGLTLFNPQNAEPRYSYSRIGDEWTLYELGHYDPHTATALQPLTPAAVREMEATLAAQQEEVAKRRRADALVHQREVEEQEETRRRAAAREEESRRRAAAQQEELQRQAAAAEKRRSEIASLYHPVAAAGGTKIALSLETSPGLTDRSTVSTIVDGLRSFASTRSGVHLYDQFFTDTFNARYFDRVFDGDGSILRDMEVFNHVDFVALATLGRSDCTGDRYGGAQACTVVLRFKMFDRTGALIDSDEVREHASGLSQEEAIHRAAASLGQRGGSRLLRSAVQKNNVG